MTLFPAPLPLGTLQLRVCSEPRFWSIFFHPPCLSRTPVTTFPPLCICPVGHPRFQGLLNSFSLKLFPCSRFRLFHPFFPLSFLLGSLRSSFLSLVLCRIPFPLIFRLRLDVWFYRLTLTVPPRPDWNYVTHSSRPPSLNNTSSDPFLSSDLYSFMGPPLRSCVRLLLDNPSRSPFTMSFGVYHLSSSCPIIPCPSPYSGVGHPIFSSY